MFIANEIWPEVVPASPSPPPGGFLPRWCPSRVGVPRLVEPGTPGPRGLLPLSVLTLMVPPLRYPWDPVVTSQCIYLFLSFFSRSLLFGDLRGRAWSHVGRVTRQPRPLAGRGHRAHCVPSPSPSLRTSRAARFSFPWIGFYNLPVDKCLYKGQERF